MRPFLLALTLAALAATSACQTTATDDPNSIAYSRSNTNKAKTDDPIKALQKY
ncbi:MAG: hypothetical protein INR68_19235 [Methylobacterium mesophilicum]|nr:hypothetical protein [Methylobacterium mesophilicum]